MIVAQTMLFAVLIPNDNSALAAEIKNQFPNEHLQITPTQWFIATTGTAIELSTKLGITDGSKGTAIVLAVSSYYGRAASTIWEWVSSKIGAPVG